MCIHVFVQETILIHLGILHLTLLFQIHQYRWIQQREPTTFEFEFTNGFHLVPRKSISVEALSTVQPLLKK